VCVCWYWQGKDDGTRWCQMTSTYMSEIAT